MTHVSSVRSPLRRIIALFAVGALALSLSVTLTLTSAKHASALCLASKFAGTWRSSDDRLSRIDVWSGEDCGLYARAWSTCRNDSTRDCSWDSRSKKLQDTPDRNFRFFSYNWSNADEVLQLTLKSASNLSAFDHIDYTSGKKVSFTVSMTKDR
ncbi:hypothetical protein GCM10010260_49960 [Streptomyces filipinensis]|uniref:Uncharacterized protein n=1 Tax=Streptomyces filipinensis TaxID=66887 RepID=A0A918IE73_9ACTN|nr:hypothetical protein [Streptomyces filipinensis]GGV06404.1 hypothetical protein GCM10010260_49960 [Streptomyces filipinensis]